MTTPARVPPRLQPKHKKAVKRLKVEAQVAKEALSSSQTHFINLEGLVGDQALSLELTRETLEKIMAPYTAQVSGLLPL